MDEPVEPKVIDGREWRPFLIAFDSPDGAFCFEMHALSHEHAELLLTDLKRTGRVIGEVAWRVR